MPKQIRHRRCRLSTIVADCPSAAAPPPCSAPPTVCVSHSLSPLCRARRPRSARRPRVAALSPRGEPPSAGLPAARVSRSPDPVRQAVKPQSPQRLLAAYKYPVCLAACICRRHGIRFVINARSKGRAAGNTANNITRQATHQQHNNATTTSQPSARPDRGACDTT